MARALPFVATMLRTWPITAVALLPFVALASACSGGSPAPWEEAEAARAKPAVDDREPNRTDTSPSPSPSPSTSSPAPDAGGTSTPDGGAEEGPLPVPGSPVTCKLGSIVYQSPSDAPASAFKNDVFTQSGGATQAMTAWSNAGVFLRLNGSGGSFQTAGSVVRGPALLDTMFGGTAATYCGSTRSTAVRDPSNRYRAVLRDATKLTSCDAGTPVAGSLVWCTGPNTFCPQPGLSGTLEGKAVAMTSSLQSTVFDTARNERTETRMFTVPGFFEARSTPYASPMTVLRTFVYLPSVTGGSVYCAAGATITPEPGGATPNRKFELSDLRRLGACEAGTSDTAMLDACVE